MESGAIWSPPPKTFWQDFWRYYMSFRGTNVSFPETGLRSYLKWLSSWETYNQSSITQLLINHLLIDYKSIWCNLESSKRLSDKTFGGTYISFSWKERDFPWNKTLLQLLEMAVQAEGHTISPITLLVNYTNQSPINKNQFSAIWSQTTHLLEVPTYLFRAERTWVSLKRDFAFRWNQWNRWELEVTHLDDDTDSDSSKVFFTLWVVRVVKHILSN